MTDAAATPASALTPLRAVDAELVQGCRILARRPATYSDGSEERVLAAVETATDLSSLSDELTLQATDWPTYYHLSTARANLLRGLALDPAAMVLEVGAGCGALTHHLAERCAAVDALEPELARAQVVRRRTRDLANVEVFVGDAFDLPVAEAYDLVVVVGVLEYVGGGVADTAPYHAFLERAAALLRPGGTLLLAIENRLGVKYLAGAPEDHTGRQFDSIQGYPGGANARTFSRRELTSLLAAAGLSARVLSAFPDYKLTRALLTDELFKVAPSLAWRIPSFPSPDWAGAIAPRPVSELALWRELVEAGLGPNFGNSMVVLATKGAAAAELWPAGRLAAFYQLIRRSRYATETVVRRSGRSVRFERRLLDHGEATGKALRLVVAASEELVPGREFLDVLADAEEAHRAPLLSGWVAMVDHLIAAGGPAPIDCLPHNLIVRENGELAAIDQEWQHESYTRDDVIARGILVSGPHLLARSSPSRWRGETVEDVLRELGGLVGLARNGGWMDTAVRREAELQAEVSPPPGHLLGGENAASRLEKGLRLQLGTRLAELPLADHLTNMVSELARLGAETAQQRERLAELDRTLAELDRTLAELEAVRRQLEAVTQRLERITGSPAWKASYPLRRGVALARQLRHQEKPRNGV